MFQRAYNRLLFSIASTLFQVPYPVSPLLTTLTKTAGCIPTIPILERFQQRRCRGPRRTQRLCVILFRSSLLNFHLSSLNCQRLTLLSCATLECCFTAQFH